MNHSETIDEVAQRAKEQIQAARLRAEKELDRAARQASQTLDKTNKGLRQHPYLVGAIAGSAIIGGVAAWMIGRKRSS